MKTRNIFLLALTAILGVSCHSWDEPSADAGMESFGNKYIQATNVKTIAEVKSLFQSEINNNSLKEVTQSMQIQGIIVGDDAGSNLYKQLYIQDATGAICLSIDQSGLYTSTAVGQCIMVELQGLYIGGYGKQGQVGVSYTNPNKEGATPQVGRMSRYVWQEHFKLIPAIDGLSTKPLSLRSMESLDITADCGKLVKLVGIQMKDADGKITFAPDDGSAKIVGGCVNRDINGMSNVVVRTSTYAKFAAMAMPTEKINITGIASRYNDTWQIMIRTTDDIEKTTGDEKTDDDVPEVDPAGTGTVADPYNVAAALAQAANLPQISKATDANADNSMVDVVVKGYVKSPNIDTSYGNATYYICDDEKGMGKALEIYRGYSLNGEKFTKSDEIKAGDLVVVQGTIVNFKGTLEFTTGSKILSINGEGENPGGGGETPNPTGDTYLDESFANGQGNFTIEDKVFSGVWTAGSYGEDKYMMATSYIKADGEDAKKNHDAESWLISPEINLSAATNPVLTFAQVINKFFGTVADEAMVYAKKEGGEWTKLTITYPATPTGSFTKFTDEGANVTVSLADYKSAKTQIAFVYKGTASKAGTWEIKDIKVAEAQ